MNPLPDEHDLIWVFEAEPEVIEEPGFSPYFVFVTERGADKVEFEIDLDSKWLSLRWTREGQEVLDLSLSRIARLEVVKEGGEGLLCWFEDDHERVAEIQLKPYVRVKAICH